jgi:hypothetical protein
VLNAGHCLLCPASLGRVRIKESEREFIGRFEAVDRSPIGFTPGYIVSFPLRWRYGFFGFVLASHGRALIRHG